MQRSTKIGPCIPATSGDTRRWSYFFVANAKTGFRGRLRGTTRATGCCLDGFTANVTPFRPFDASRRFPVEAVLFMLGYGRFRDRERVNSTTYSGGLRT